MRIQLIPILFLAVLGLRSHVLSQSEKRITIEHADSLIGRVINGENVQELIGNVRFFQDKVIVTCDHAVQFKQSGNIQLQGNVVIVDDSVTMRFPRGMYHRVEQRAVAYDSVHLDDGRVVLTARYGEYNVESKKAFFRNHVVARDNDSRLTSDSLTYFRSEQRTVALSNVEIQSYPDNLTIRGGNFQTLKKEQYSRMTVLPVMVKFDTSTTGDVDTLVVRSKQMESFRGETVKRLVATDSVEIIRKELSAVAGVAYFYTAGDSIMLRRSPVIWHERTQVAGDSINVYLKKKKLNLVQVMSNTTAISQSDSLRPDKFDQITGEDLKMIFGENGIEKVDVNDQAISIYHLYEDSTANGLNKTSGDRIVMHWEDKKLNSIRIYGGVEGQYFPENLTLGKESEFELRGFFWRTDRPVLRESDFPSSAFKEKSSAEKK